MQYQAEVEYRYPATGDWVVFKPLPNEQKGVIQAILPRKSKFSRQVSGGRQRLSGGRTEEQIISANVDNVFIVSGLDGGRNFSLHRIERYITLARSSSVLPVIVLNKTDLCPNVDDYIESVKTVARDIPIHTVSAKDRTGLDELKNLISSGQTAAFLGSSGVGKSALINALLSSEKQETGDVRKSDRRGRHTTTRRELILLPDGGAVIDTPGMREIQMWGDEDDLDDTFQDIIILSSSCRFKDCRHDTEPGCAVISAIEQGTLSSTRLESYHQLHREFLHLEARQTQSANIEERNKWKKISKLAKEIKKRPR
ncbi:ribosome small subunit-dependent GTPase A [Chloroflexota bacterium]